MGLLEGANCQLYRQPLAREMQKGDNRDFNDQVERMDSSGM
jgi:hypothetical protein